MSTEFAGAMPPLRTGGMSEMTPGVRLHRANRITHSLLRQGEARGLLFHEAPQPYYPSSLSSDTQGSHREKPPCAGEPRKARGETGKRMGAEDKDETGCYGPSDVLKEIEIENEIYKK